MRFALHNPADADITFVECIKLLREGRCSGSGRRSITLRGRATSLALLLLLGLGGLFSLGLTTLLLLFLSSSFGGRLGLNLGE